MVWLRMHFNTVDLPITVPERKLMEVSNLVAAWRHKVQPMYKNYTSFSAGSSS